MLCDDACLDRLCCSYARVTSLVELREIATRWPPKVRRFSRPHPLQVLVVFLRQRPPLPMLPPVTVHPTMPHSSPVPPPVRRHRRRPHLSRPRLVVLDDSNTACPSVTTSMRSALILPAHPADSLPDNMQLPLPRNGGCLSLQMYRSC